MLSIPDFLQGIETDNPAYDFTHNFNKMMVLYRLIGGRPNISISTTHDDGMGFQIKAKSAKDATYMNNYINGITYTVYGNQYGVTSVCEKKIVQVSIQKK